MTVPLYADAREAIACKTRFVPDFPVPGVIFEDLTPVLADAAAFLSSLMNWQKMRCD
ncbi:Adenine phosphoribosyltransferase [Corynebacterium diphtheriae subsp. lausannense]|nr:Adenine phosphoribosyltransferase [Corynebacterium diphtheriae subsp. lausannense]